MLSPSGIDFFPTPLALDLTVYSRAKTVLLFLAILMLLTSKMFKVPKFYNIPQNMKKSVAHILHQDILPTSFHHCFLVISVVGLVGPVESVCLLADLWSMLSPAVPSARDPVMHFGAGGQNWAVNIWKKSLRRRERKKKYYLYTYNNYIIIYIRYVLCTYNHIVVYVWW